MYSTYPKRIGQRFGLLIMIDGFVKDQRAYGIFLCDCGNKKVLPLAQVLAHQAKSCGCLNKQPTLKPSYKHGLSRHPLYRMWGGIKKRCYNPTHLSYPYYGGKGIVMFQEWLKDPAAFVEWGINNGWVAGLEIDRIDNNGNYEPSNCRFVTKKSNMNNRGCTRVISYDGKKKSLSEWAEILDINYSSLRNRLENGWSIKKAFETPINKNLARWVSTNNDVL